MSFFTSLTGLDAANADLGIISNNIANVSTYGFKQSSAQFGDIYATSPLQNATSTIGQGVLLKGVTQDFSQGNITSSTNSLDMAIQGQGFFMLKPNLTANTQVYTRDGSFSVNNNRYVVDSAGQYLQVFPVNSDGSVVATGLQSAQSLQLPTTSGLPKASSQIQLGVNLPSDATIIPEEATYTSGGAQYAFDPNNSNTYNQSTSITVYDSLGNPSIATIYYVKTSNATPTDPTNKWQTYIYLGGNQINPALLGAQDTAGKQIYINQFGQTTTDPSTVDPTFNSSAPHALYYQDDQNKQVPSQAASYTGGIINSSTGAGFNFGSTDSNTIVIGKSDQSSHQSGTWLQPTSGAANEEYNLSVTTTTQSGSSVVLPVLDSVSTASGTTLTAAQLDNMLNTQYYDLGGLVSSDPNLSTTTTPRATTQAQTLTIAGGSATATNVTVAVAAGDSLATIASKINQQGASTGVTAQIVNTAAQGATPVYKIRVYSAPNNPNSATQLVGTETTPRFNISTTLTGTGAVTPSTGNDTIKNQLAAMGIGMTGSISNGNLTFYSTNGTNAAPFSISVNNQYGVDQSGGIAGGFTGSDFSSANAKIGTATQSEQGLSTQQLFKISVDGSDPIEVSLPDSLDGQALTGEQLATELTKSINNAFGDQQYISLNSSNNSFNISATFDPNTTSGTLQNGEYANPYAAGGIFSTNTTTTNAAPNGTIYNSDGTTNSSPTVAQALSSKNGIQIVLPVGEQYTPTSLVAAVQTQVDANIGPNHIHVGYDTTTRSLTFKPVNNSDGITNIGITGPLQTVGVSTPVPIANEALGLSGGSAVLQSVGAGVSQGSAEGGAIVPNGAPVQNPDQRRYGVQVVYQKDSGTFQFLSGTTGQNSSISISPAGNVRAANLLGIASTYASQITSSAGSGLPSSAAVTTGSKATIDISGTFAVTNLDNTINVTVNGVQGQVVIPPGAYTGTTFATAIQNQINQITDSSGNSVGGVKVTYNPSGSNFIFTSGTTGSSSIVNVVGPAAFGLASCTQTQGTVPNVTVLKQATDSSGNLLYIDGNGNKTTNKPATLPNWTPLYLTPGELTFNTAGNLISPQQGAQYTPYDPQNGANPITLNVNYGKYSTQYSQPFSVLSLSQDGYTSGSLSGINIDSTGVVRATYTNGQQQALGKVVLANFSSPTGLKQLGNSDYVATSLSGPPTTGQAGSSGFGTIQGGALEESNVDMTAELVALITAQRNFQANAKAIETDTQLTSTIINIRS